MVRVSTQGTGTLWACLRCQETFDTEGMARLHELIVGEHEITPLFEVRAVKV